MLSIIIPSYKETLLQKTIDGIRENARGAIEIIAVLDGYDAEVSGASVISIPDCRGMRNAINTAAAMARGEHLMKTDGHCKFAPGFDTALTATIEPNWVVIPRRYELNPETWEFHTDTFTDYEKLILHATRNKFHGARWVSRHHEKRPDIDETMMFQGSCWVMHKAWYDTVVAPLDEEHYGHFTQEPVEIAFKTWQAGGKLMVNKTTWYAHKHRDWNRTHHVTREDADAGNLYALQTYRQYYDEVVTKKFSI